MEIGTVRPAAATALSAPVPGAPTGDVQAVRTDLPPPAAVTSPEKASPTRTDTRRAEPAPGTQRPSAADRSERQVEGEVIRDKRTEDFVYRWIDVKSGDVVSQYPEEAILRLRAMADAWTSGPTKGRTAAYDVTT